MVMHNHEPDIHKYYDSHDPHLQTLAVGKRKNYDRAKKISLRIMVVVALFLAEGVVLWAFADSKTTYSPVKSEVIVGVKPPRATKVAQKPIEKMPTLAVADMYLVIPKLYVNAPIDPVGVTASGDMATSPSLQRVAWYKDGTKPGSAGSAVFAGHYGSPQEIGIFRSIDKLVEGDELEVRSKNGVNTKYKVYKKATYEVKDVPLQDIFNKSDGQYLNLITCVGNWDPGKNVYDKRLIVFAKKQ